MSIPTQSPPLLLTKRLTAFLHANASPHLPTLLITTPTGKLLAHASQEPVSLLRTHATVAASLQQIHTSSSAALPTALPGARTPEHYSSPPAPHRGEDSDEEQEGDDDDEAAVLSGDDGEGGLDPAEESPASTTEALKPATITVQLTGGTVLIRRLKCGLLLVCVGPPSGAAAAGADDHHHHHSPAHSHHQHSQLHLHPGPQQLLGDIDIAPPVSTSPSEVESQFSAAGSTTTTSLETSSTVAVVAMRKHASSVARWLDSKLGTLTVPDEGVGVE